MDKYTVAIEQEVLLTLYLEVEASNQQEAKSKAAVLYENEVAEPDIRFYGDDNWEDPQWGEIQTTICGQTENRNSGQAVAGPKRGQHL